MYKKEQNNSVDVYFPGGWNVMNGKYNVKMQFGEKCVHEKNVFFVSFKILHSFTREVDSSFIPVKRLVKIIDNSS